MSRLADEWCPDLSGSAIEWGTWRHAPTCSVGRQNAGPVGRTAEGVLSVIFKLAKPLIVQEKPAESGAQGMVLVLDQASICGTHNICHNVCTIVPTALLTLGDWDLMGDPSVSWRPGMDQNIPDIGQARQHARVPSPDHGYAWFNCSPGVSLNVGCVLGRHLKGV